MATQDAPRPHRDSPLYAIWDEPNLTRDEALEAEKKYVQSQAGAYLILTTLGNTNRAEANEIKTETLTVIPETIWDVHFPKLVRFYNSPEAREAAGASDPTDVVEEALQSLRSCRADPDMKLAEVEVLRGNARASRGGYESFIARNTGRGRQETPASSTTHNSRRDSSTISASSTTSASSQEEPQRSDNSWGFVIRGPRERKELWTYDRRGQSNLARNSEGRAVAMMREADPLRRPRRYQEPRSMQLMRAYVKGM